jgi:hypothetical protein
MRYTFQHFLDRPAAASCAPYTANLAQRSYMTSFSRPDPPGLARLHVLLSEAVPIDATAVKSPGHDGAENLRSP